MHSEAESGNMEGDWISGEVGLYSISYLLRNFSWAVEDNYHFYALNV